MSELQQIHEQPPHQVVSDVLSSWLETEVTNSYVNGNAVLNDYAGFTKSLTLPYNDPANVDAGKARNHYQRLKLWTDEVFTSNNGDDQAFARQMFGVMMGLSGAFRMQCFVMSSDQSSYMNRRYGNDPLGLDIAGRVEERFLRYYKELPGNADLARPVIKKQALIENTNDVNQTRDDTAAELFSGKRLFGLRKALYAARWCKLRKSWLDLGVDYILYGAQERGGDISRIPMLEPKTIAEAKLIYPFKNEPLYFIDSR